MFVFLSSEVVNESDGIFQSPFFPKSLGFSDTLAIISIILGIISIVLSFIIYKLSNSTSEQLAKDAAQYAFDKLQAASVKAAEAPASQDVQTVYLNEEEHLLGQAEQILGQLGHTQIARIDKRMLNIVKSGRRNSKAAPWVYAASFPVQLKGYLGADETVILMLALREKGYLRWSGNLENQTPVYLTRGSLSIESLNSCEP